MAVGLWLGKNGRPAYKNSHGKHGTVSLAPIAFFHYLSRTNSYTH
jgi:hypothetical protein